MMNYNDESLLEMVEMYAESQGFIASEKELSNMFDEQVMPEMLETHGKLGEAFDDDTMVNEEFNNWSDMLCKDGVIHSIQYTEYGYVGEYV